LAGWAGVLQADAFDGYNRLYLPDRKPGPIVEALCWSHARRKFFELADIAANTRRGKKATPISPIALAVRIKHLRTRPYTPRTNGKAERLVHTSLREWAYDRAYNTSDERAAELPVWLHRYNWHRPHGSLRSPPNQQNILDRGQPVEAPYLESDI
jgi:transposase InsO family protein